ncbi:shootin-1 [Amblyraja radiata]|uniref:shootin-1 n=1 Tax=Amblyraja radiata TaxID=386614 RepID=UPI0014026DC6|nr:shootin-1 [Amblyraja radiata]
MAQSSIGHKFPNLQEWKIQENKSGKSVLELQNNHPIPTPSGFVFRLGSLTLSQSCQLHLVPHAVTCRLPANRWIPELKRFVEMATSEEEQITTLNDLSKQAIDGYDNLVKENEKMKEENIRLTEEKDNAVQQVKELHRVSRMVIDEVGVIQSHLDMEKNCRETAEIFASKLHKDNKNLKRISMLCMGKLATDTLPVELSLGEDSTIDATNMHLDKDIGCTSIECQHQIQDLREKLTIALEEKKQLSFQLETIKGHCKDLTDKLRKEEERNIVLATKVDKQNQILAKYNKVSTLALEEYESLEQSLEMEKDLREEAESFAHEMLIEQKKLKRQSRVLIQNMVPHEQLMKALDDLAIVTEVMEKERILHEKKIKEMEEHLNNSRLQKEINSLRKQLTLFEEDKDELKLKCKISDQQVNDLKHTIDELQKHIQQAESSTPPPPPPPPPPPLPKLSPSANPLKNLMMIICKKQKASNLSQESDGSLDEVKKQAVDEMMERIKKGVQLRKVNCPNMTPLTKNAPQEYTALRELRGILKSNKVGTLATVTQVTGENELERILCHRKEITETDAGLQHNAIDTTSQCVATLSSGNIFIRNNFNRISGRRERSKKVNAKLSDSCSVPNQRKEND